jgi:PmbA protein
VAGSFQDGIIIEELMGTHTANAVTGDFSVGALGHICKNGERRPFKGVILSGNAFELLKNVKAVGNDLTFYGGFGSPSIYITGLKISGT